MNMQRNPRTHSHDPVYTSAVRGGVVARVALVGALACIGWATPSLRAASDPVPADGTPAGAAASGGSESGSSEHREASHEISASVDYLIGYGDVTVPVLFSLSQSPALVGFGIPGDVVNPPRDSSFYGATISYSAGQAWYFDLSYVQGSSEGSVGFFPVDNAKFSLDENYFQAYVRYTFPRFRGTRLSLYARAGLGYNDAEMQVEGDTGLGPYEQTNQTKDLLGAVGAGIGYALYTSESGSFRIGIQGEFEGFYGSRSQESTELIRFTPAPGDTLLPSDYVGPQVSIDNTLYGAIGRGTVRFQVRLNESGRSRAFLDAGVQAKYTEIDYDKLGSYSELLWGPYFRVGFRYSF